MAGHSHFANIAHKKALIDAKRGKQWSKLAKAIIVAAKMGGGDPNMNPRLRLAIDTAKAVSLPKDNIQRAIKRGTGELEGENYEESLYEGYGPGGAAVMCEILTDNRNRTAPEIRKLFEVYGGNLGGTGCVAWVFQTKGLFIIEADKTNEDALTEIVLEAGGDDVKQVDDTFEVTCELSQFQAMASALEAKQIPTQSAKISRIPTTTADLDLENGQKMLKLMEKLDEHDDVQNVYSNFNIPDEILSQLEQ